MTLFGFKTHRKLQKMYLKAKFVSHWRILWVSKEFSIIEKNNNLSLWVNFS